MCKTTASIYSPSQTQRNANNFKTNLVTSFNICFYNSITIEIRNNYII